MFSTVDQGASGSSARGLRRRIAVAAMAAAALAASAPVLADPSYPSQPIKLVIPYGTGGVSDTVGRLIAQALGKALNGTVITENKGGAGGTLGAAVVARAAPNGYTL